MWVGYAIGFGVGVLMTAGVEYLLAEKWSRELGLEGDENEEKAEVTDYDVLDHCNGSGSNCQPCGKCKRER